MTSRVDMHCHSTASQLSRLGVQRSLGLPECATPPEEVYELAKRRGMDFVTITDHDTIDGCLELADRPDCFVSEELTARFAGEPQAVHVLCYGITPGDHEWLQANAGDLEACAAYLHENEIACALAHPFYNVDAPLTPRHRRRLAELFPVWEVRNGSRAAELNMPAAIYIETHGGTGIGGSDDHAGVDIGRTFTEVPAAATPEEFLRAPARGRGRGRWGAGQRRQVGARGDGAGDPRPGTRRGGRWRGRARSARGAEDRPADDQRGRGPRGQGRRRHRSRRRPCLLEAWLRSMELELRGRDLLAHLQADDFSHADLYRRARRTTSGACAARSTRDRGERRGERRRGLAGLFEALAGFPYAPAAAFLGAEKAKLTARAGERAAGRPDRRRDRRDHGVTRTIEQIRELGVPGFEVEVVGTDAGVDRRLPAAAKLEVPFYDGM